MGEPHRHAVLIVEDNADNLAALVAYFDSAGFTVDAATSVEEALQHLRGGMRPCGLVVDAVMPRHDGWSLVETLRADPAFAATPVVFYSGAPPDDERAIALRLVGYFMKPADPAVLPRVLTQHCPHRAALPA